MRTGAYVFVKRPICGNILCERASICFAKDVFGEGMKILKSLVHETIEENTAVTVGKFDGIHKGHELLTQKLREQKKEGLASCVQSSCPL